MAPPYPGAARRTDRRHLRVPGRDERPGLFVDPGIVRLSRRAHGIPAGRCTVDISIPPVSNVFLSGRSCCAPPRGASSDTPTGTPQGDRRRAGSRAFRTHGYARASMTQIAESAGFTKGAVYSNFESKPELFSTVCIENINRLSPPVIAELDAMFANGARDASAIDRIADSFAQIVIESGPWQVALGEFRQLAVHDPQVAESYATLLRERTEQAMRLLDGHPLARRLGPQRTREAIWTVFELISLLALEHAAAPHMVTPAAIRSVLASVLGGLSA
ncbi:TetR/AcrR family transcriptional regulator [Propionibacterium freudenreichii]|nr:TetR/AcrR family transcriptional regulator [Propionibacterium freudenreichii]MCT3016593.1 TetR/AcrR family transcriptional regulator [Propionibacterium freudenreichii]